MKFSISRYNPDQDKKPYLQHYDIDILPSDRMLLDVLLRIKEQDNKPVDAQILPRRRLRLGCHEHQWHQWPGLHHARA